ncbi:helicase C-terminal domain-containing protein [Nocardia colli]|uniref:helicase C-terminal domain-containing protein n=1 Tax=Nocardia colli TaxID=2545717 RepID=UPI001CC476D8|nr:helicase C-terminal domain-containing protein [Nocardia colli]
MIKVNTGGGKTIDGLVILQSYLNEGLGPALYVTPGGGYMETQLLDEAHNLGIAVVTDPDDAKYLRSEAIAVVNTHKLFNGRTVFSEKRVSAPMAPIGSVVIDDAHAALSTLHQTLSLSIPSSSNVFIPVIDLFEEDLKQQSADSLADIREGNYESALLSVPFWAIRHKADRLRELLRSEATKYGSSLYWPWPAVQEVLAICRIVITSREIAITPPCPPIGHVTAFSQAKRRIYLTATLSDDSVLVTDFGALPESVAKPITPLTAGDIGERMILAPQEINPAVSGDEIRKEVAALSRSYNTVVVVPSAPSRSRWAAYADEAPTTNEQIVAVVKRMKSGVHVGLVVLTNRYDGIDLPQDACRVLVLDGLPGSFSGDERLQSLLTSRESGVDDRQVQRIEQGIGRGVRSNEDHCVVILIGPRLAKLTIDPRTLKRFSPATQAQLELSRTVTTSMGAKPIGEIMDTAKQALSRDSDWVRLAKSKLHGIAPQPGFVSQFAAPLRHAFDAAVMGGFVTAAKLLADAVEAEDDVKLKGWLRQQHAIYLDQIDPSQAQDVLRVARTENTHTLRPLSALTIRTIATSDDQADTCARRLTTMFASGSSAIRLGFEEMLDDLKFDPARTEEFEAALLQLGLVLGFESQRPENEIGEGPDNLWSLGEGQYWVIEAKSGATSTKIGKRDAAQLAVAELWFKKRYADTCTGLPVMIHPANTLYKDATAPVGAKALTEAGLKQLTDNVRAFSVSVAVVDRTRSEVIGRLLADHKLNANDLASYLAPIRG